MKTIRLSEQRVQCLIFDTVFIIYVPAALYDLGYGMNLCTV